MSYRELADKPVDKNAQLRAMATNAIYSMNLKLDRFINRLDSKILPNIAKRGKFKYTFKFPFWFRLVNSDEDLSKYYSYIIENMQVMGYKTIVPQINQYCPSHIYSIRFEW